jgi:xylulokinase
LLEGIGLQIAQIRTSGGGALSSLWRQIHADVFNREVITVSGSAEGGAYGAALVAGAGTGVWSSVEEATQVVQAESVTVPIPGNIATYDQMFHIYQQLYAQLKGISDQVAGIYVP